jgi:hypothetical protein
VRQLRCVDRGRPTLTAEKRESCSVRLLSIVSRSMISAWGMSAAVAGFILSIRRTAVPIAMISIKPGASSTIAW